MELTNFKNYQTFCDNTKQTFFLNISFTLLLRLFLSTASPTTLLGTKTIILDTESSFF